MNGLKLWLWLGVIMFIPACRIPLNPSAQSVPLSAVVPAVAAPACPQATPEIFRVEPVKSPSSEMTQMITVRLGYGEAVTVEVNGTAYVSTGDFTAYSEPANITVPLAANTANMLKVTGRVRVVEGANGCKYGGYELRTDKDRNGNPLVIEQRANANQIATATPVATAISAGPSPTPGTVILIISTRQPTETPTPSATARSTAVACIPISYDSLIAKIARPAALASTPVGACVSIIYKSGERANATWVPKGSSFTPTKTIYVRRGSELVTLFTQNNKLMAREFLPGVRAEDRELLRDGDTLLLAASRTPVFRVSDSRWVALVDTLARR